MDRQQMERCLEQVAAYRASGQTARAWAEANGLTVRTIASWCAHSRRWQARLQGVVGAGSAAASKAPGSSGFVAARVAPANAGSLCASSASVRVELNAGAARLQVHWPLAHTRELAALLREIGR